MPALAARYPWSNIAAAAQSSSAAVHNRQRRGGTAPERPSFSSLALFELGLVTDRSTPAAISSRSQAACGATTDGAADPADGGADPPAPRPALPAMAPINAPRWALSRFRERPGCYDIAWWRPIAWRGRGITPRWVIIAHINPRLTPALRHGSSLLHQARERSEPFLDRLMAERHPGYMAAAREWQSAVPAG